ncbi:MAG: phosphatase PAP2 family protein [Janthinobacterium lividum]
MTFLASFATILRRLSRRHRSLWLLLAVIIGSGGLFLEVAHELREDRLQPDHGFPFDWPILNFLHQHEGDTRCALADQLSALGGPVWLAVYTLAALGVGLLARRRRYGTLVFSVGAVGGTMAFNLLAKYHFDRLRPEFYRQICHEAVQQLIDPSFPSGHTMASVALASTLGIVCGRTRWRWVAWGVGLLFALSVSWARLYLAAHYPSDVLAGWLATGAWVGTWYLVSSRYLGEVRRLGQQL